MRHGRRRGRLGLVQEHRRALLRNLARHLITHQEIITTHGKAKETSRFVDQLVTIAKQNNLHARRHLISKLGSGSELYAKRLLEMIAPKFSDRKGGYTRVLHYKERKGDRASLSLLQFTVPVVEVLDKKPKKKKEKAKKKEESQKEEIKKETPKKGGFLSLLRRFLKGDDDKK